MGLDFMIKQHFEFNFYIKKPGNSEQWTGYSLSTVKSH